MCRQHRTLPASEPAPPTPAQLGAPAGPVRLSGRQTHTPRAHVHTRTHAVTLVGEDGLGQGGRGGSHAGRGAAGSDTGGSSEPRILTDLREGAESAGQR